MKTSVMFVLVMLYAWVVNAQMLTEKEVVEKAILNYPAIRIAGLEVQHRRALERTAFNPPQPSLIVETPTDLGLGIEVEQELDFPSVYTNRKQWLKSQTALAENSVVLTKNEVVRNARLAYLNAQVDQSQTRYYTYQDSLWNLIVTRSQRLFDAGDINRADLIFAERQSALVNYNLLNAQLELTNSLNVLTNYINQELTAVSELAPLPYDTLQDVEAFYFRNYYTQAMNVAETEIKLLQSQRLPGLLIGYTKDTEPESAYPHRLRAGVTIPIWQGQYSGEIEAAKANVEITRAESESKIRESRNERIQWQNTLLRHRKSLVWFETEAFPQMNELTDIYNRLYDAGEIDYAITLRNIAEAFDITTQYLDAIWMHNQAVIELDYLKGTY